MKNQRTHEAPPAEPQEIARYGDWIVERGTFDVVACPGCAFTFDAVHTDGTDGVYSCPLCQATNGPPAEPQEKALAQEQILSTYGETFRRLAESDGPPPPADLEERALALSRTVARLYGGADPSPVVTAAIKRAVTGAYHDGLETGCALPCGHCPEPDLIAEAEARGRKEVEREIVAWLEEQAETRARMRSCSAIAEDIEHGVHLRRGEAEKKGCAR